MSHQLLSIEGWISMSNLKNIFKNKKVLIPTVVADDPDIKTTVQNICDLANNGADVVNISIPFSDPVADGPVIQRAYLRAFDAGVNTEVDFDIVKKVREKSLVPIIFTVYLNIAFKYGYDKFCEQCQKLGILGLLIPDATIEEYGEIQPVANKYGVDMIPTIAPTSENRIEKIAKTATGFINYVTPNPTELSDELLQVLKNEITQAKAVNDIPAVINFDVDSTKDTEKLLNIADGLLINNKVTDIAANNGDLVKYITEIKNSISVLN